MESFQISEDDINPLFAGVTGCLAAPPSPPAPLQNPLHPGKPHQKRPRQTPSGWDHSQTGTPLHCPLPPPGTWCSDSPCMERRRPPQVTGTSRSKTWSSKGSPDPHRACSLVLALCPLPGYGNRSLPHQAHSAPPSEGGPAAPPLRGAPTGSWQQAQQHWSGGHGVPPGHAAGGAAHQGCTCWSTVCPESPPWGTAPGCNHHLLPLPHFQRGSPTSPGADKAGSGSDPSSKGGRRTHLKDMKQTMSGKSWEKRQQERTLIFVCETIFLSDFCLLLEHLQSTNVSVALMLAWTSIKKYSKPSFYTQSCKSCQFFSRKLIKYFFHSLNINLISFIYIFILEKYYWLNEI